MSLSATNHSSLCHCH